MKTLKITSPLYVGEIAPLILKFYNRVNSGTGYQGVSYESLYASFTQIVQFGGRPDPLPDVSELWVTFDGDEPVAFATWRVMGLPHIGKTYCDFMFNSSRNQKTVVELCKQWIEFGKRHRAPLYEFNAINEKVAEHLVSVGKKLGIEFVNTGVMSFIGR